PVSTSCHPGVSWKRSPRSHRRPSGRGLPFAELLDLVHELLFPCIVLGQDDRFGVGHALRRLWQLRLLGLFDQLFEECLQYLVACRVATILVEACNGDPGRETGGVRATR